jgi:hypothetical protein
MFCEASRRKAAAGRWVSENFVSWICGLNLAK